MQARFCIICGQPFLTDSNVAHCTDCYDDLDGNVPHALRTLRADSEKRQPKMRGEKADARKYNKPRRQAKH